MEGKGEPSVTDLIRTPLAIVDDLFRTSLHIAGSDEGDFGMQELVTRVFPDEDSWLQVPLLTAEALKTASLQSGTLVRYRGMIQDMFDPEYFVGVYEELSVVGSVMKNALYRDSIDIRQKDIVLDSAACKTMERSTYYCVPIPGETAWSRGEYHSPSAGVARPLAAGAPRVKSKRRRDGDEEACVEATASDAAMSTVKRHTIVPDSSSVRLDDISGATLGPSVCSLASAQVDLNLPLPSAEPPVILKVHNLQLLLFALL